MRVSDRLLAIAAVVLGVAACSQASGPPEPRASAAAAASPTARAPYGVVADVRYAGNVATLNTGAKVYLFLREKGARMPLAVQYFDPAELPKRVSFATREPLSNVELVARLSLSGRVEKSAGDPEAHAWIENAGHPPQTVRLVLASPPDAGAAVPSAAGRLHEAAPRTVIVRALVTIDSADGLPADAPVFVVARDAGQPMPLAVRKLAVRDLPAEVVLSDADAMGFSHRLSDADSFTVFARVSPAARARQTAGDLQSATVSIDAAAVPPQVALAIHATQPDPAAD